MASEDEQAEIEREFAASWNWMEQYYAHLITELHWISLNSILELIAELRKCGYDRQFRAGQSLATFKLSRSRKHGLRSGQAMLAIDPHSSGEATIRYYEQPDTQIQFDVERVEITPEMDELLKRLLAQPID